MKLHQYEQSGFIFERSNGFKLALDIAVRTPLGSLSGISVDAVIVSHLHPDHLSAEHIKALSPKRLYLSQECLDALGSNLPETEIVIIKSGDTLDIGGIRVGIFDVDHGPNATVVPKENFGFLFEVDGQKVYFAGDMFYASGLDVTALEVDTALIPVGGFYTFGPAEAVAFVKTFKKVSQTIPMHDRGNSEMKAEFEKLIK